MKRLVTAIDMIAFAFFLALFGVAAFTVLASSSLLKKRRHNGKEIGMLSFAVFDLISGKYSSMLEDALLDGYISKHHYFYIDFDHRHDRFENMQGRIFFHSIAAHPDNALYNSGLRKSAAFLAEVRLLAEAFSAARRDRISFVKAHDPHILGLNGLLIARLFRIPCVLHMNSDFDMKYLGTGRASSPMFMSRTLERFFESLIMKSYDSIMADRELYRKSKSFPADCLKRYTATGVRVDATHYLPPDSRKDLKKELGVEGRPVLLHVGRLHPVKYPQDSVMAFALVKKSLKDAVLLIAGSGTLKDELMELAAENHMDDSVIFLGPKRYEELIDIMYTADVLLAPHGGMTLVESALAATPIVAYDFDWHPEFLEDGKMGFIVPFRDVAAMADRAIKILSDKTLREEMGRYCREAAEARCSRGKSIAAEKKIYDALLKT